MTVVTNPDLLTDAELTMVEHLASIGKPVSSRQVADSIGIGLSAAGKHLRRLEEKGLAQLIRKASAGQPAIWFLTPPALIILRKRLDVLTFTARHWHKEAVNAKFRVDKVEGWFR